MVAKRWRGRETWKLKDHMDLMESELLVKTAIKAN